MEMEISLILINLRLGVVEIAMRGIYRIICIDMIGNSYEEKRREEKRREEKRREEIR